MQIPKEFLKRPFLDVSITYLEGVGYLRIGLGQRLSTFLGRGNPQWPVNKREGGGPLHVPWIENP